MFWDVAAHHLVLGEYTFMLAAVLFVALMKGTIRLRAPDGYQNKSENGLVRWTAFNMNQRQNMMNI